ncbi:ATPase [Candidatus Micrarchaeota archaeon]|nr:MAG: ATPase [Candidatus Micrarchaeota archaeon]
MDRDRIASAIPGLDELIQGGFLEGSSILLSGGAGTGKTIFAMQFIYNGAKDYGDPGLYITLEEGPTNVWWNMKSFKWNISKYEKLIRLYRIGTIEPKDFAKNFNVEVEKIKRMVNEMNVKRLVIDSTTAFAMWMSSPQQLRYSLFKLADELKDLKCTSILISETVGGRDNFSRFGVEEFVTDGIIRLYFMPPQRAIFIRKMRGTKHNQRVHPFTITDKGIVVNPKEEILWESLRK